MLTDEQFGALQEYVWQKNFGDGWRAQETVWVGRYTDFLSANHYIEHNPQSKNYFRITMIGERAYWIEMYHGEKKIRYDAIEFIKLSLTTAKDYDKLRNQVGLLVMILAAKLEFKDGKIVPVNNHPNQEEIKIDLDELLRAIE